MGDERRITHLADAVNGTDAVNLRQLKASIAAAGIGGVTAGFVTDGDAATLASAQTYADSGDATTLASAQTYAHSGDAATLASARTYADSGDAATLASAQTYADAGDEATLASAQTYADAGDATTLSQANAYTDRQIGGITDTSRVYTDARFNALASELSSFQSDVWQRLDRTDSRIDRTGAMTAAMAQVTANAAGGRSDRGRIAVGIGTQNGHGAMAIGYGRRVGERGSMTLSAAFSGSDTSAGVGLGLDL